VRWQAVVVIRMRSIRGRAVFYKALFCGAVRVMRDSRMMVGTIMMFHVFVVFRRNLRLCGRVVLPLFRSGSLLCCEMLRVPVVRGPKTFCETIFHANSLSEDPGADASPTRVIRSTAASEILDAGCAAGRIGSFRTIGKDGRVHSQLPIKKTPKAAAGRPKLPVLPSRDLWFRHAA
jgi:hypothetical protein